jgi:hypothetical protein
MNNANDIAISATLFPLGQIVITPAAREALNDGEILAALRRHANGDWGDLSVADIQENELSLQQGFRLLSAYNATGGTRFWIITEADRSSTCILLPDNY